MSGSSVTEQVESFEIRRIETAEIQRGTRACPHLQRVGTSATIQTHAAEILSLTDDEKIVASIASGAVTVKASVVCAQIQGIVPLTATQGIFTASSSDDVITCSTIHGVITCCSHQKIIACIAVEVVVAYPSHQSISSITSIQGVARATGSQAVVERIASAHGRRRCKGQIFYMCTQRVIDAAEDNIGAFVGVFHNCIQRITHNITVVPCRSDHAINVCATVQTIITYTAQQGIFTRTAIQ